MLQKHSTAALFALLCVMPCSSTKAVPLSVGSVLIPAAAEPDPTGGIILASSTLPFFVPGAFSGLLTSQVISGDPSNPLGGLTFVYELTNDGVSGPNAIGRFTTADWSGFLVDASYQSSSPGVAPASIDRNPNGGGVVGFNFVPTPIDPLAGFLSPGSKSSRLVLQSDAPGYIAGVGTLIDGSVITVGTFAPSAGNNGTETVPDGGSTVLALGLALGAFMTIKRDIKK